MTRLQMLSSQDAAPMTTPPSSRTRSPARHVVCQARRTARRAFQLPPLFLRMSARWWRPFGAECGARVREVAQHVELFAHSEHVERRPIRRLVGGGERELFTVRRPGQVESRESLQWQGVDVFAVGSYGGDREGVLERVRVPGE